MSNPLKVDPEADAVATQSAHFLGVTKKQFVSEAIAFYSESRRAEIEKGVQQALATLDGSRATAITKLSGLSPERIAQLGGIG